MLDFEELETAAVARVSAGNADRAVLDALGVQAEPPSSFYRGPLPRIARSRELPGPEFMAARQAANFRPRSCDGIRMHLFVFYGSADYAATWFHLINELPDWLDVAVYERAGHGLRSSEPLAKSVAEVAQDAMRVLAEPLRDYAHGGRFEGAPVAFLGHGTGGRPLVEFSRRARLELGIEPTVVVVLDDVPPDTPFLSEEGYRLACQEPPLEFFDYWAPDIGQLMRKTLGVPAEATRGAPGTAPMVSQGMMSHGCATWQYLRNEVRIYDEYRQADVDHKFRCDLHISMAMGLYAFDDVYQHAKATDCWEGVNQLELLYFLNRSRLYATGEACLAERFRDSFDGWARWTTGQCRVYRFDVGHVEIKFYHSAIDRVISVLSRHALPGAAPPIRNSMGWRDAEEDHGQATLDLDADPLLSPESQTARRAALSLNKAEVAALLDECEWVSLGCFCGVAAALQALGLRRKAYPFDWVRCPVEGVVRCFKEGFVDFFTLKSQTASPNVSSGRHFLTTAWGGSFWHHGHSSREAGQRRIERLLGRGEVPAQMPRVFVRAANSSDELGASVQLLGALREALPAATVRLLVLMDLQEAAVPICLVGEEGLLVHAIHKDLFAYPDWDFHDCIEPYARAIAFAAKFWSGEAEAKAAAHSVDSLDDLGSACVTWDGGNPAYSLFSPKRGGRGAHLG